MGFFPQTHLLLVGSLTPNSDFQWSRPQKVGFHWSGHMRIDSFGRDQSSGRTQDRLEIWYLRYAQLRPFLIKIKVIRIRNRDRRVATGPCETQFVTDIKLW